MLEASNGGVGCEIYRRGRVQRDKSKERQDTSTCSPTIRAVELTARFASLVQGALANTMAHARTLHRVRTQRSKASGISLGAAEPRRVSRPQALALQSDSDGCGTPDRVDLLERRALPRLLGSRVELPPRGCGTGGR